MSKVSHLRAGLGHTISAGFILHFKISIIYLRITGWVVVEGTLSITSSNPCHRQGHPLFVCNEKGPFQRWDCRKPWLSWLIFYYCWALDRKLWINSKAKILRSSYQRWTWTLWDCFELPPSQQKGSFPIWWAWNDSPSTDLHPPNPQRLCGFSDICTWTQDLFIYIYHLQGRICFSCSLNWFPSALPTQTPSHPQRQYLTCITPRLWTSGVPIRSHWFLQRMQGNPSQWDVTRKERSITVNFFRKMQ